MDVTVRPPTADEDARWAFADGLRALANFIEETPDAPLRPGPLRCHYDDADEFDRRAAVLGGAVKPSSPGFETCERKFGPITYGVQTDGRKAQQIKRREEAIAKRERELGLSTEDIGQAA